MIDYDKISNKINEYLKEYSKNKAIEFKFDIESLDANCLFIQGTNIDRRYFSLDDGEYIENNQLLIQTLKQAADEAIHKFN